MPDIERVRLEFRPADLRMLFIGESPPARGGHFYFAESGFTGYTRRAFELALGRRFDSDGEFLETFRDLGRLLDDASQAPVDHLAGKEREAALRRSVGVLADRLRQERPAATVVMLKKIVGHVDWAIEQAGIEPAVHRLPFPGNGHQKAYVDGLVLIVRDAVKGGLLIGEGGDV